MDIRNIYFPSMTEDLPHQFKHKRNFTRFLKVFDDELRELLDAFYTILESSNLSFAQGKQLDLLGEIIGLSREQAKELFEDDDVYNGNKEDELSNYAQDLIYYTLWKNADNSYETWHNLLYDVFGANIRFYEGEKPNTIYASSVSGEGGRKAPNFAPLGVKMEFMKKLDATINTKATASETIREAKAINNTKMNNQIN